MSIRGRRYPPLKHNGLDEDGGTTKRRETRHPADEGSKSGSYFVVGNRFLWSYECDWWEGRRQAVGVHYAQPQLIVFAGYSLLLEGL